jgi:hypothetical protein
VKRASPKKITSEKRRGRGDHHKDSAHQVSQGQRHCLLLQGKRPVNPSGRDRSYGFEIVLVDDGSKDNSHDIVKAWLTERGRFQLTQSRRACREDH